MGQVIQPALEKDLWLQLTISSWTVDGPKNMDVVFLDLLFPVIYSKNCVGEIKKNHTILKDNLQKLLNQAQKKLQDVLSLDAFARHGPDSGWLNIPEPSPHAHFLSRPHPERVSNLSRFRGKEEGEQSKIRRLEGRSWWICVLFEMKLHPDCLGQFEGLWEESCRKHSLCISLV